MIKELVGRWKVIGCQLHAKWLPPSIFSETPSEEISLSYFFPKISSSKFSLHRFKQLIILKFFLHLFEKKCIFLARTSLPEPDGPTNKIDESVFEIFLIKLKTFFELSELLTNLKKGLLISWFTLVLRF